jgi:hypothetical protein
MPELVPLLAGLLEANYSGTFLVCTALYALSFLRWIPFVPR